MYEHAEVGISLIFESHLIARSLTIVKQAPHECRAAVGQGRVVGAARHVAVPLLVVLLRKVVVFQR